MKQQETKMTGGIDVSKNRLDLFELETGEAYSIPNELESIQRWLDRWDAPMRLAIEPTNRYHKAVAQAAHARSDNRPTVTKTGGDAMSPPVRIGCARIIRRLVRSPDSPSARRAPA